jgi:hypothetical protein
MSLWDIPVPALLSGSPLRTIPSQVQSKIPELVVENAKVWTLVNIIIYNIPVQYRLLVMSVANVFWQAIVSKITSAEIVLENAGAESLGMDPIQTSTSTSTSASFDALVGLENNTIISNSGVALDSIDAVYQSVGGGVPVSMTRSSMESSSSSSSSAVMEDGHGHDYGSTGSGDEQGLLGNRMESRTFEFELAAPAGQRDFQQTTHTGNGTDRIRSGSGIDNSTI